MQNDVSRMLSSGVRETDGRKKGKKKRETDRSTNLGQIRIRIKIGDLGFLFLHSTAHFSPPRYRILVRSGVAAHGVPHHDADFRLGGCCCRSIGQALLEQGPFHQSAPLNTSDHSNGLLLDDAFATITWIEWFNYYMFLIFGIAFSFFNYH